MENSKLIKAAFSELKRAEQLVDHLSPRLKTFRRKRKAAEEAQKIVQVFCQSVQEKTFGRISRVVSDCLKAVFSDPYEFKIILDKKRGKAEARLVFVRDGEEFDPTTECGGGVLDVAAFTLRLATLRPFAGKVRQVLFADEPFKHVSRNHSKRLALLLETLSKEMGIQFVIITHNPDLICGKVIELS